MPNITWGYEAEGETARRTRKKYSSSGRFNRLDVYDWLADIPLSDQAAPYNIIEVSFNHGSRKDFFRNDSREVYEKGDWVAVEGIGGFDIGEVSLSGELVRFQMKKKKVKAHSDFKKILRLANNYDLDKLKSTKKREYPMLIRSRELAKDAGLHMKLTSVEIQADGRKATFYYTADSRVDFRELIRSFASEFHVKVEMRQIGSRQEAAILGGVGPCGREVCCASWLTNFPKVDISAAKIQGLSLNPAKLAGPCGRLKCCLNFELDMYIDALKHFPKHVDRLETTQGTAFLQKKDIFKELMWYSFKGGNHKLYPLTIKRVLEIQALNKKNKKVESLEPVDLEPKKQIDEESFVDVVGQISLKSLEESSKNKGRGRKRKKRNRSNRNYKKKKN